MDGKGDRDRKVSQEVRKDKAPVTIATAMLLSDSARKMVTIVTLMLRRCLSRLSPSAVPVRAKFELFTVLTR